MYHDECVCEVIKYVYNLIATTMRCDERFIETFTKIANDCVLTVDATSSGGLTHSALITLHLYFLFAKRLNYFA